MAGGEQTDAANQTIAAIYQQQLNEREAASASGLQRAKALSTGAEESGEAGTPQTAIPGASTSSTQPTEPQEGSPAPASAQQPPVKKVLIGDIDLSEANLPPETLEKLEKGFLRNKDYTRKAQELAEQRRLLEEQSTMLERARVWENTLSSDPELYAKVVDHIKARQIGAATNEASPASVDRLPENFDTLDPREQAQLIAKLAAKEAAQMMRPDLQRVEQQVAERERVEKERTELFEAYPETEKLDEENDVVEECDRVLVQAPGLTLRQAYEIVMAPRWKAAAAEGNTAKLATHRAAAAIQRPGMATPTNETFDPRKFRNDEEAMQAAAAFWRRKQNLT